MLGNLRVCKKIVKVRGERGGERARREEREQGERERNVKRARVQGEGERESRGRE